MALSTQPYKGTRDFYPDDMAIRAWMFEKMRQVCSAYGYAEYDGPILEPYELYAAKTGDEIVSQQLYSFVDRGDRKVAIRPEMTPTLARMVAGQINELPKPVRWFSIPNCWRYERPQRGRLREFWQLNVDVLGGDPLLADAEILALSLDLMKAFGGEEHVSIRVSNRKLMDHFFARSLLLSPEATLKVVKLIDARSKLGLEKYTVALTELGLQSSQIHALDDFFNSPLEKLAHDLPCEGVSELTRLFLLMQECGINTRQMKFDPTVMRGLDYYTGTVFEMYDVSPENNRAMFGGGRYDNLLGLFGNHKLAGVGLGMGDVTLRNFLETHGLMPQMQAACDVLVSLPKLEHRGVCEKIARLLRSAGLRVATPLDVAGFGVQLKQAVKLGACFAVLIGDEELGRGAVVVKDLVRGEQKEVAIDQVASAVTRV